MKWHLTSRELRSQERSAYDVLRERKRLFWIVTPILIPVARVAGPPAMARDDLSQDLE